MQFKLGTLLLATLVVAKQPNILFVLTDDQGKYVGGLEHMPKLQVCTTMNQIHECTPDRKTVNSRGTRNKLLQAFLLNCPLLPITRQPLDRPYATQHQRNRRGTPVRRLPKSSLSWLERQLPATLDARSRLQYLLRRQALERSYRRQLQ